MIIKEEFENKFKNLESALNSLKEAIVLDKKNEKEEIKSMFRDSCIQRFEYSYELSWKFMKYILEKHDIEIETRSPKQSLKTAFKN
jgi:nucleotidyltransferase substrate binding protein (TIGR01987 family)